MHMSWSKVTGRTGDREEGENLFRLYLFRFYLHTVKLTNLKWIAQ